METTTISTTSTTSTIDFNICDLAGIVMLNHRLLGYFIKGKTATFNVYYGINGCEVSFLIKIRKDYISVTNTGNGENVIRINIKGRKNMDCYEAYSKSNEFVDVIGAALDQYLNHLADEDIFDY